MGAEAERGEGKLPGGRREELEWGMCMEEERGGTRPL